MTSSLKALKCELIPFLLGLLEVGLETAENPAAIKAQIVKALKAMQCNLKYGEEVGKSLSSRFLQTAI